MKLIASAAQKESPAAPEDHAGQAAPPPWRFGEMADNLPARFVWLGDAAMIASAFVGAYFLVPNLQGFVRPDGVLAPWLNALGVPASQGTNPGVARFAEVLGAASIAALASLAAIDLLGGYRRLLTQSRTRVFLSAILGPLAGMGVTAIVLFGLRSYSVGRLFLFTFVAFQSVGLGAWRMGLRAYKEHRAKAGHYARGVLLVGTSSHLNKLAAHFKRRVPAHAFHVLGGLRVSGTTTELTPEPSGSLPSLGGVDSLGDLLIHLPINEVVVVQSTRDSTWLSQVIHECDYFGATLRIVPEAILTGGPRDLRAEREYDAMGLPALVLSPSRSSGQPQFLKRLLDVTLSATMLVLLAPVFAAIAMAIKITTPSLPVFYRWRVVGYKGREFVGYKFTTMQADADARKAELTHLNEMQGPVFKIKSDPRATSLGRWLRKYSLNELPQLWSVLRGDMSLVGPRPAFPHELSRYEYWHKRKLSAKPGITCLWQVSGRNNIADFDDWVRLDLQYIDTWSLWLDIKILIWTIGAIFKGTGS